MKRSDNWARMQVLIVALFGGVAMLAHGADGERSAPNSALAAGVADAGPTLARASTEALVLELPALPAGVTQLEFSDFFRHPVGPRGLELTESLLQLEGKRVRILGYMIQQSDPASRCFLFSPRPVKMHEREYGFADELPASTMHVFTDASAPETVPFTPGPLLLTGTLSVGNRQEPSGRVSLVRLQLDPPTEAQRKALLEAVANVETTPAEGHADHDHDHGHDH
jgi:hypothetical protein